MTESKEYKGYLLLFLVITSLFLFSGRIYAPRYSIYNSTEYGTSRFYDAILETGVFDTVSRITISPLSLETYKENGDGKMVIIVGSERQYLDGELEIYHDFVSSGGTILLFEDFGPARAIAKQFGLSFFNGVLKETNPDLYTNSPDKPLIFDETFSNNAGIQLPPIQLNRAVGVSDLNGFYSGDTFPILISTSSSAFIDINDNDVIEKSDFAMPVPIALFKTYLSGQFILFGDASIPLNQNWNSKFSYQGKEYETGNAFYTIILLLFLAQEFAITDIIFDESHYAIDIFSSNGLVSFIIGSYLTVVSSSFFALGVGIMVVFLLLSYRNSLINVKNFRFSRKKLFKRKTFQHQIRSRPTSVERLISEQYVLYQIMGKRVFHIAIHDFLEKIEMTGKGKEFLAEFKSKYPDLNAITDFNQLRKINAELHQYVKNFVGTWL